MTVTVTSATALACVLGLQRGVQSCEGPAVEATIIEVVSVAHCESDGVRDGVRDGLWKGEGE